MKKIKAIVKRTDDAVGHMTWISDSLANLQKTVDGPIEVVPISNNPKVVIICNEEGKIRDLDHNFYIGMDRIVGDVIICGVNGEDFDDIPITFEMWKTILKINWN